ncbi:MAG: TonB-dependent receptor [Gammaproteobacteria bacterium]|nr:TonB-dependent receptor [Gammaproteobacteria bacterium]
MINSAPGTPNNPVILTLTVFVLLAVSGVAAAQVIEEIIVTAQKREQSLQDVPISISTFTGEFLEDSGIDTLQQLGQYTPNLSLAFSSQLANNRIVLRGVGSVGNSAIEPSVAVFVDGIYIPRPSSVIGTLTDLEIVEVLRGPQGTLFGRNASMGALNIRTRKPGDEFSGDIRASYGNYNHVQVAGALSGAFSPEIAGRVAFQYSDRNGYGQNSFTENGSDSDVGKWEDGSVRGKLFFEPAPDLDITLTADFSRIINGGGVIEVLSDTVQPEYLVALRRFLSPTDPLTMPTGEVPEAAHGFDNNVHQDHRDYAEDEQWGIAGDVNWRIGEHTVRSLTGYRKWYNDTLNESVIRLPMDLIRRVTFYDVETVSQELQLLSPTGGLIEYVAGAYFYREDYGIDQAFDQGPDFCSPFVGNLFASYLASFNFSPQAANSIAGGVARDCVRGTQRDAVATRFRQDVSNYALYGQLTLNVTEQLRVTGGLRWTDSNKEGSFLSLVNNPISAPPSPANPFALDLRIPEQHPDLEYDEEEITWLANVSYSPVENLMLFATYATGFRSGGFNPEGFDSVAQAAGADRVYDTETVDNIEVGAKGGMFDNRVVVNLNYFHTEIDDLQDRRFDGVNFLMQNVEELTQQGVELDIQARPVDQLYTVLGVSYLDSSFGNFPNATSLPADIAAYRTSVQLSRFLGFPPMELPVRDLTGDRNHFSPQWQLPLVAEWSDRSPVHGLGWFVRGEYQYVSGQNVGADTNQAPQTMQPGYDIVNARLGLRGADDGWEISGFVRNVFDQDYCQVIFIQALATTLSLVDPVTGGGMQRCVVGAPRVWGVEASYRF